MSEIRSRPSIVQLRSLLVDAKTCVVHPRSHRPALLGMLPILSNLLHDGLQRLVGYGDLF